MDFAEFNKEIFKKAQEAKKAINQLLADKVEAEALRFVDDNFRDQGFNNNGLEKWESSDGTILVKSGALRRGFYSEKHNNEVHIKNDVEYAKVHNEGFEGQVSVPAHKRATFKKSGAKKKKIATGNVKAHTRKMKIKKRQFAPYPGSESATLNQKVNKVITEHLTHILKP